MKCALILLALLIPAGGAGQSHSDPGMSKAKTSPARTAAAPHSNEGYLVFQQNCARCHTQPQDFSQRISQTVAMHMRVRANLNETQYKALLHFLNP